MDIHLYIFSILRQMNLLDQYLHRLSAMSSAKVPNAEEKPVRSSSSCIKNRYRGVICNESFIVATLCARVCLGLFLSKTLHKVHWHNFSNGEERCTQTQRQ